jgi:hypothetical protein
MNKNIKIKKSCPPSLFNLQKAQGAGGLIVPLGEDSSGFRDASNPMEWKTGGGQDKKTQIKNPLTFKKKDEIIKFVGCKK